LRELAPYSSSSAAPMVAETGEISGEEFDRWVRPEQMV
jgi:hypothetical protein